MSVKIDRTAVVRDVVSRKVDVASERPLYVLEMNGPLSRSVDLGAESLVEGFSDEALTISLGTGPFLSNTDGQYDVFVPLDNYDLYMPTDSTNPIVRWQPAGGGVPAEVASLSAAVAALDARTDAVESDQADLASTGRFLTEAWDDFDRANGALAGQTAPSGQVWAMSGSVAAQISSDKLVSPGAGAFYASLVLGENVGEVAADFTLEAGIGANDGMALIVNPHSTGVFTEDLIHLDWTRATWTLSVVVGVLGGGNPLVTIATGQIVGLDDDAHRMVMALRGDLCTISLDGAVLCSVRDARFAALAGRRATWEIIRSSGSGLDMNFSAISAAGYVPERKPAPSVGVADLGAAVSARVAAADPWSLGMPDGAARVWTQDPRAGLVNCDGFSPGYGFYQRVYGAGRITTVALEVVTSAGNICVAVYRNNNIPGGHPAPATRIATTGGVACPAVGYAVLALDVPVDVEPGDWIMYSTSAGTAVVLGTHANISLSFLINGFTMYGGAEYPAPLTPAGLGVGQIRGIAIQGN
jgi:hypothetical protein